MARILLVDDDDALRTVFRLALERMGHVVHEARNGREALRIFAAEAEIELMLTDIVMPDQEGLETILALRRRAPTVKIIAMSGGGLQLASDYLSLARKFGAAMVLQKPFQVAELEAAVTATLGSREPPKA